jgi:hypothetical protein
MKTWKSKLFGDNRLNFYGWIFAALFCISISVWALIKAFEKGAVRSPVALMLVAIYLIVLGHFGLALQNYCSRVAERIESDDGKQDHEA